MPLEYWSEMSAWEAGMGLGQEREAMEPSDLEREEARRAKILKGAIARRDERERGAPFRQRILEERAKISVERPLPAMPMPIAKGVLPPGLLKQIESLPLRTQVQIRAEMKADPAVMKPRILMLLMAPDPFRAILIDQYAAIAEVAHPGSAPTHRNLWPVLQKYTRASLKLGMISPENQPREVALEGLGLNRAFRKPGYERMTFYDLFPQSQDLGMGYLGDTTDTWKKIEEWYQKDGEGLLKTYAEGYANKTLTEAGVPIKSGSAAEKAAAEASDAEFQARMKAEETRAADEKKKEEEAAAKKKGAIVLTSGVFVLVAALVAAAFWLWPRKPKFPMPPPSKA